MELFHFARTGDISGVMRLIEQRLDVTATNRWNLQTAFYIACENGHTAVAQYLLDNGADVRCGRTKPLFAAVRYGHHDCVKLLLDYRADANCYNFWGETPMSVALQEHPNDISLILLLLQYDAVPSEAFGVDIAVNLLKHATAEHVILIRRLIDGNFVNLTSENTFLAAFDFAFQSGSVEMAEEILSGDGYSQIEQLYPKAAYYSAKNNWANILSKLIEKGVDVNTRTKRSDSTVRCL